MKNWLTKSDTRENFSDQFHEAAQHRKPSWLGSETAQNQSDEKPNRWHL
jgi:hypothetical protein